MYTRTLIATFAVALVPQLVAAQDNAAAATAAAPTTPVTNPASAAFKADAQKVGKNLMAAADEMPADRYGFKPTAAQMSFGDIVAHLTQANDFLCAKIGGVASPTRAKLTGKPDKATLVSRLKDSFAFCDQAFANLDDSKLGEQMQLFGPKMYTRAEAMTISTGDWADHYSQVAIYMRLNGLVPPTAKKSM